MEIHDSRPVDYRWHIMNEMNLGYQIWPGVPRHWETPRTHWSATRCDFGQLKETHSNGELIFCFDWSHPSKAERAISIILRLDPRQWAPNHNVKLQHSELNVCPTKIVINSLRCIESSDAVLNYTTDPNIPSVCQLSGKQANNEFQKQQHRGVW